MRCVTRGKTLHKPHNNIRGSAAKGDHYALTQSIVESIHAEIRIRRTEHCSNGDCEAGSATPM